VRYGYHLLFMAAIVAALGISGYRSGTIVVLRGLPIRRAENPRLFVFGGVVLGCMALALAGAAIYVGL
jgi:hypothetical protein